MKFPVWKTIKLGVHQNVEELINALQKKGNKISDWAMGLLNQPAFQLAEKETELKLAVASVGELGFPQGARLEDIYKRIQEVGKLCPAEAGPMLREIYGDQPNGEWLRIAMEPITDSDDDLSIFDVFCGDDERWLNGSFSDPDDFWRADYRFVFAL